MSRVEISLRFVKHPCTNHTDGPYTMRDPDCEDCNNCNCDAQVRCCGRDYSCSYCPDCGNNLNDERPPCYYCEGECCGSCDQALEIDEGQDPLYTGTVTAAWENGELAVYRPTHDHPHVNHNTFCLGECAELFENVTTTAAAIEAVCTHISGVDFNDALGGPYDGIEAA